MAPVKEEMAPVEEEMAPVKFMVSFVPKFSTPISDLPLEPWEIKKKLKLLTSETSNYMRQTFFNWLERQNTQKTNAVHLVL